MKNQRLLCLLLFATLIAGSAGADTSISSCSELQAIPNDSHGNYFLTGPINCSETISWNAGAGFRPIDDFYGTFDGGGYEITGLYINRASSNLIGLFHRLQEGALVKGVGLVDIDVTGKDYAGGLVGLNHGGTVQCCYTEGQVTGDDYVGGLVGYNTAGGAHYDSIITQSFSDVEVQGVENVGGLLGMSISDSASDSGVRSSFALGDVHGNTIVGGLIGKMTNFTITSNSFARGSVSGSSEIGGLIGHFSCRPGGDEWISKTYAITPHNLVGYVPWPYSLDDCHVDLSSFGDGPEMLDRDTYGTAFFVGGNWDMDEADGIVNDGYPYLLQEDITAEIISPSDGQSIAIRGLVDFQGSVTSGSCLMTVKGSQWDCEKEGGGPGCPSDFPIVDNLTPHVSFNALGTYNITFRGRSILGLRSADTVTITVEDPANVRFVINFVPESVKQGQDFCRPGDGAAVCPIVSEVYLESLGSSAVEVDVAFQLLDAATGGNIKAENFPPDRLDLNPVTVPGASSPQNFVDLTDAFLTWLDADTLPVGNYILVGQATEPTAGDVLAETEKRFSILLAGRALPVPELDVFLLPLIACAVLAVVLFVGRKK